MPKRKVSVNALIKTDSGLSEAQIQRFFNKTPTDKIKERPGKGGKKWVYVAGSYVTQVLNSLFGFKWHFRVVTSMTEALATAKTGTVVVQGRLKVKIGDDWIIKEQYGRKEVAFKREPVLNSAGMQEYEEVNGKRVVKMRPSSTPLDFGNDLKAAATDAKKKCASELGLFADVYSGEDFFEAEVVFDEKDLVKGDPVVVADDIEAAVDDAMQARAGTDSQEETPAT